MYFSWQLILLRMSSKEHNYYVHSYVINTIAMVKGAVYLVTLHSHTVVTLLLSLHNSI